MGLIRNPCTFPIEFVRATRVRVSSAVVRSLTGTPGLRSRVQGVKSNLQNRGTDAAPAVVRSMVLPYRPHLAHRRSSRTPEAEPDR